MSCINNPWWLSHGWGFVVSLLILAIAIMLMMWAVKEFADYCWYEEWGHDRKVRKWREGQR